MRIGIDARMMGKGYGIGRYVEQLIFHLQKIDRENEYVLFVRPGVVKTDELFATNFSCVETDIPWYSWQEQLFFPSVIKRAHLDLMHFPHWNVPLLYRGRFVVTVHDLTMYHFPRPEATTLGPALYWIKDKAHRLAVRHAARAAKHILVTSKFTKQDLHETLGVSTDKMTVTYQAPFEREGSAVPSPTISGRPYFLYVGAAYPHKNLENLIKAWRIFVKRYGGDYELLLVGKEDSFWGRLLSKHDVPHLPNCRYLGFVPDGHLKELYAGATAFVFPSLYEGFGLPPLEAMAAGVPVVSSDRSCLPEVLGDAPLYINPESPEDMASALHTLATDSSRRQHRIEKGREQAARYSWERLAASTLDAYRVIR